MSCARFESDLVDRARRVRSGELSADRTAALDRHVRACALCAARLDREQALSAGLRRLAEDSAAPPIDPAAEHTVLAAFDDRWSSSPRPRRARWTAAAALIATAAAVVWMVANRNHRTDELRVTPERPKAAQAFGQPAVPDGVPATSSGRVEVVKPARARRPPTTRAHADEATFVMWPGAGDLPKFESGQLMRVALPASVAVSLGLRPSRGGALVQTDVLVGQDGYARAVRLVR